jgi:ATP-dependent Clp protease protease subunit
MATPPAPKLKLPPEVYGTFCSGIDQSSVQKILNAVGTASQNNVQHIHLLFQSTGGSVADGIALYNFLKTAPIDITLYNVGSVQSVAAIAYLGAKKRKTSARATFVFHRVTGGAQAAKSGLLKTITEGVVIDDGRIESIMREHIRMSEEKWAVLDRGDLWFTAQDAIDAKIADEIAEFAPPVDGQIFNL